MPDDVAKTMADAGDADDSQVRIDVYQSGGLIAFTRRLADLTRRAQDQQEEACYGTATILMAAAALEAMLAEFAYECDPDKYTTDFRKAGVPKKYQLLTGKDFASDHPDAEELWDHRIAIVHSEPQSQRSRKFGSRVNRSGAGWAITTLEVFARVLWGARMPSWLRTDAEL